jgi:hypothetical protein
VAPEELEPLANDEIEFEEDLPVYTYQHSDVFSLQPSSTPATVTSGTETDSVALIDIGASPIGSPPPSRGELEPIVRPKTARLSREIRASFGIEPQPKKPPTSTGIASSIEIRYLERIQELSDELADLQRASIARSIEVVQEARALPPSPENLPAKIAATLSVTQSMQQLDLAFGTETQMAVEELIALSLPETAKQADDNLDIAQSIVLSISNDAQAFSRTSSLVLREKQAALEQVRRDLAIASECVAYHAKFTKERSMSNSLL